MTLQEETKQSPAPPAPEQKEETQPKAENPTEKIAEQPISKTSSDERLYAALGYIPMLFIAPLIMKPKSSFCQMHGKQGLLISGITFISVILILPLIPLIGSLLFLALIGLIAIGGFQAYSGIEWKIPVIHDIAMKIPVDSLFTGTTVKPVETNKENQTETPKNTPETPPSTSNPETPQNTPETPPSTSNPETPKT